MITQQDVKQALEVLTSKFGVRFTDLPIVLSKDIETAATDFEYIYLSENLRPKDLPTIIAHEVLHFLTGNGEWYYKYGAKACNIAEDFVINSWLKRQYGLDVSKVRGKGLIDSKPWSLIKRLKNAPIVNQTDVVQLASNELMRCAVEISYKTKFERYSLMVDTLMDEVDFADSLLSAIRTSLPINLYAVMRFWCDWLSKEDQIDTEYVLNTEYDYSHLICWGAPKWSRKIYDDPALAIACTSLYLTNVENHSQWLEACKQRLINSLYSCKSKIDDLRKKTPNSKVKQDLLKAIRRKKALKHRIKHFDTRGANYWLTNTHIIGRYYSATYTPTLFHRVNTPDDCIPYSRCDTPLYKQLGWCLRQAVKNIDLSSNLYSQLQQILDDLGASGLGSSASISDGQSGKLQSLKNRAKISDILTINSLTRLISKILKLKGGFDSTLKLNRSKACDTCSPAVGYTLGSDISNAVISEIGLLSNEYTKLDFLVKLAQGSLFQVSSMISKRLPLIMYIDVSSSMGMQGKFGLCIAYALSIATMLRKEKRGVGLVVFDDTVRYSKVIDASYTMKDLLDLIAMSMCSGGTRFDVAYDEGLRIKMEQGWGNCIHLVMSDGEFGTPLNKQPNDKHYALLFKSHNIDENMQTFFDCGCWECSQTNITRITSTL